MGLDSVELLMEVEEKFDIGISDAQATAVRTAGDLYDILVAQGVTPTMDVKPCQTRRVYGLVRDALQRIIDTSPRRLRPSTPVSDCLEDMTAKELWAKLKQDTSWYLPELELPNALQNTIAATAAVFGVVAGAAVVWQLSNYLGLGIVWGVMVGIIVGFTVDSLLRWFARPARSELPIDNLRELTSRIMHGNHEAMAAVLGRPVLTEGWQKLRAMIAEQMGLDPREVLPESRLIEDLGMD